MDLTSSWASRERRPTPTSSARTAASRGGFIRTSIRATARRRTRFRQILDAYETLIDPDRRRRYDSGQLGPPSADDSAFGFAGFDFSAAADGAAEPPPSAICSRMCSRRPSRAGHREPAIAAPTSIQGERCRSRTRWRGAELAGHVDAPRYLPSVRGHRRASHGRIALPGLRRVRRRAIGARAHGVRRRTARTAAAPAGCGSDLRHLPRPGRRAPRRIAQRHASRRRRRRRARARGRQGARRRARRRRPATCMSTSRCEPHPVFRASATTCTWSCRSRSHEAALGARIEIPTPDGPARLRIPPGRSRDSAFACASAAAVGAGRAARRSASSKCG